MVNYINHFEGLYVSDIRYEIKKYCDFKHENRFFWSKIGCFLIPILDISSFVKNGSENKNGTPPPLF